MRNQANQYLKLDIHEADNLDSFDGQTPKHIHGSADADQDEHISSVPSNH
jgi:hypothetical protein